MKILECVDILKNNEFILEKIIELDYITNNNVYETILKSYMNAWLLFAYGKKEKSNDLIDKIRDVLKEAYNLIFVMERKND